MWVLRVKDRGRDLAVHSVDRLEEANELRRVYELLGYASDKISVEHNPEKERQAA